MDIDKVLLEQDINYESIKDFLEEYDEDNYNKILSNISKFIESDAKIICKIIIDRSNNEELIDRACMEIITFIKYDYNYYRDIICITSLKKIEGIWIDEIKDKLLEDSNKTIKNVFEDFSDEIPQNIIYDIEIISRLLDKYDEEYIKNLTIEKNRVIEVCKRINHIMIINVKNVLKLFYCISSEYKLDSGENSSFLDEFFQNYPSVCKTFIEEEKNNDPKEIFIKDLKKKVEQYDKEEKIKYNMEIFKPDTKRIIEYRKFQLKQNKEINKMASKKSILGNLFKSNTILYGRRYGITVTTKK
ncbi:MAG: hypothetical protein ACI4ON_04040 [Clostridia bacterium]